MKSWHKWKHAGFTHHLNLATVTQWLYHPEPAEHAHVWVAGDKHCMKFEGRDARRFNKAMLRFARNR